MSERTAGSLTTYGFKWGPMTVTRACELPDGVVLNVKTTGGREVDVYVSHGGRSLRVFGRGEHNRGEWKPEEAA